METEYILIDLERSLKTGRLFFWRSNQHGYTDDLAQAGIYSPQQAHDITTSDLDRRTTIMPLREAKKCWRGMI